MLLPKQVWKDIPGFEGKYQVNQVGQVRSLNYKRTGKVKRLSPGLASNGYLLIMLWKDNKCKDYLAHRLVAQAFIPNPNNLPCVNHKDENKANNCVWNLEWCTYKYNNNYGTKKERLSEAHRGKHHSDETKDKLRKLIMMLDMNNNPIACFKCVGDANEYMGKDRGYSSSIYICARGAGNTAYGYKWAYLESEVL